MKVNFTDFGEFLDEMLAEVSEQHVDDNVVRLTVERTEENRTATHVTATIGFTSLGELRQCICLVGTDFAPKTCGTDASEELRKSVIDFCGEHHLKLRGGKFEDQ